MKKGFLFLFAALLVISAASCKSMLDVSRTETDVTARNPVNSQTSLLDEVNSDEKATTTTATKRDTDSEITKSSPSVTDKSRTTKASMSGTTVVTEKTKTDSTDYPNKTSITSTTNYPTTTVKWDSDEGWGDWH